ncbi:COQ9 family protein [Pararhodobacter sp. SW119]|uniref:COQ9 family protein n=1 Tax=Pararhodobacter sp. SW119 TaxID=2780075 RepID=UPI001AE04FC2|nr:COQ9 family protein [Pararhodobacter sp. SW119]
MPESPQQSPQPQTETLAERVLEAALMHVPFDGWSQATLAAAITDTGIDPALARALFPRGGLDLALAYHRQGDAQMRAGLAARAAEDMRMRDRVALAVRLRLEAADPELVRRASALFALPPYAPEGLRAVWGTADAIWDALGDTSEDGNWYSKRAILSGVYSATLLYWLGDTSPGHQDTWAFLDRRIDEVMQFEKTKAKVQQDPVLRRIFALPMAAMGALRKPAEGNLPGRWPPDPGAGAPGRDDPPPSA